MNRALKQQAAQNIGVKQSISARVANCVGFEIWEFFGKNRLSRGCRVGFLRDRLRWLRV